MHKSLSIFCLLLAAITTSACGARPLEEQQGSLEAQLPALTASTDELSSDFCSGAPKVEEGGTLMPASSVVANFDDHVLAHIDWVLEGSMGPRESSAGVGLSVKIDENLRNQPLDVSAHPDLVRGFHYWDTSYDKTTNTGVAGASGAPPSAYFQGTLLIGSGESPEIQLCVVMKDAQNEQVNIKLYAVIKPSN